jgi:hypothetical protein
LILVSLTYAVLAGETTNAGRAAMMEFVAAPGFIAAGMLLLLAILTLLSAAERSGQPNQAARPEPTHMVRILLAHVMPVILTASLFGGIDDYADTRWGDHQFRTVDFVVLVGGMLVVLVPFAAYAPWPRYRPSAWMWRPQLFSYIAVGLAAAAAVGTYLLSAFLDKCQTLGQWTVSLAAITSVLFMISLSIYLIKSRSHMSTDAAAVD